MANEWRGKDLAGKIVREKTPGENAGHQRQRLSSRRVPSFLVHDSWVSSGNVQFSIKNINQEIIRIKKCYLPSARNNIFEVRGSHDPSSQTARCFESPLAWFCDAFI